MCIARNIGGVFMAERIRIRLNVTIEKDLYNFLDYLMIEKRMNKSAVVEHMLLSAIHNPDLDYYKIYDEFELKNYDMFEKVRQLIKIKKVDKTACIPSLKKADRPKNKTGEKKNASICKSLPAKIEAHLYQMINEIITQNNISVNISVEENKKDFG